jgi:hypothetical protein
MNFSLNGKKRISLQQAQLQTQALLRQRHIAKMAQIVQRNTIMSGGGGVKDECVKDVITYEIGELYNDVIEPQPQMEEPTIETLSNISTVDVDAVEKEPLAAVEEEKEEEEEPAAAVEEEKEEEEEPAAAVEEEKEEEEEPAAAVEEEKEEEEEEDDANAVEI